MLNSIAGEDGWLLEEIALVNVPIKRCCFRKEASIGLREALNNILSLAMYRHKSSPLAFNAFAMFVLYLPDDAPPPSTYRMPRELCGNGVN